MWEAPPQVPDAPHPRPLSEQEKEELRKKGVPLDYVTLRLARARAYAKRRGLSVTVVLWEWWQRDRLRRPRQTTAPRWDPPSENKSYDVDDFFQAALERSYALLEQEVG